MKTRQLSYILAAFGLIMMMVLSNCNKDYSLFASTEEKLEGEWKFDKVKFRCDFSFSRTDMTEDFKHLIIAFEDDLSVTQTDSETGEVLEGDWEIDSKWSYYNDENGQSVEVLEAYLTNATTGETFLLIWDNLNVTRKKINCIEYKDDGTYTYTLEKI